MLSTINFFIMQEFVLKKLIARKKVGRVGKAEVKMAVIVLYYIIMGVLGLVTFTYYEVKTKGNRESLAELFLCESTGNLDCNVDLQNIEMFSVLAVAVVVMLASSPVIAVIFSFDPKSCRRDKQSLTSRSSKEPVRKKTSKEPLCKKTFKAPLAICKKTST